MSAPEKWVSPKFTSANPVYRHLGFYGYTADFLAAFSTLEPGALEGIEKLEQLRAMEHGYPIHVGFTDQPTIGIDTPEDIAAFEQALA